jgi:hypothetical protein
VLSEDGTIILDPISSPKMRSDNSPIVWNTDDGFAYSPYGSPMRFIRTGKIKRTKIINPIPIRA